MDKPTQSRTTAAFHLQAVASFAVSVTSVGIAVAYLPVSGWIRAVLALGLLYVVTSSFTLAKFVRDRQDEGSVLRRVDQARLEKLLADHDPFKAAA